MGVVRDFKFGVWIDHQAYKPKNVNVGQKGRDLNHMIYFLYPCYAYRTAEHTNFKFGALIDQKGYYTQNAKIS